MERKTTRPGPEDRRERPQTGAQGRGGSDMTRKKPLPPAKTHAEEFYYVKQMNAKTPMLIVMDDGVEIRGHVEWYDEECIKVHRDEDPNLLIYKRHIRFVLKDPDADEA